MWHVVPRHEHVRKRGREQGERHGRPHILGACMGAYSCDGAHLSVPPGQGACGSASLPWSQRHVARTHDRARGGSTRIRHLINSMREYQVLYARVTAFSVSHA